MQKVIVRLSLTILISLFAASSHALTSLMVADGQTVQAKISAIAPNRLKINGGRIRKITGAEGVLNVKPMPDLGEIHFTVKSGKVGRAIDLFVIDDKGNTYSLILTPVRMPAESIVLHRINADREKAYEWEKSTAYTTTLKNLLKLMAKGDIPEGYEVIDRNKMIPLWSEVRLVLKKRYTGATLRGFCYEIENVDQKPLKMAEQEFYKKGVLAVAIEQHELMPGEKTNIFIVVDGAGVN